MVEAVRRGGYPVVGDLAELDPQPSAGGRLPDETSTDELLDAAVTRSGRAGRGVRRRCGGRPAGPRTRFAADARARGASRPRAVAFRARRAAARLADRNAVAGRALGAVLRRRGR